jgi:hypothetical protein
MRNVHFVFLWIYKFYKTKTRTRTYAISILFLTYIKQIHISSFRSSFLCLLSSFRFINKRIKQKKNTSCFYENESKVTQSKTFS